MTTISIRMPQAPALTTATMPSSTVSIWGRVTSWFRSTWCVMNGGHYKVLHTDPSRLALRCVACGHMSPGWEVGTARIAHHSHPTDAHRARVRRAAVA
jgi:hypothetical protein